MTKLNRNKSDFEKNKKKLATFEDISDMDKITTINSLDLLLQEKRIKAYVYNVENNTGVTNAMNILTYKVENLKQKASASSA